jgi:hypothetical protein
MSIEVKVCKKCGDVVTDGYPCPNCATDNYGTQPTDVQQTNGKITPHICAKIEWCHNVGGKRCGSHQPCYTV